MFRRNSLITKLISLFFKLHGFAYMKEMLGAIVDTIITENKSLEIDPNRLLQPSDQPEKQIEENAAQLNILAKQILDAIVVSLEKCPIELRKLLKHTYEAASKAFPEQPGKICEILKKLILIV